MFQVGQRLPPNGRLDRVADSFLKLIDRHPQLCRFWPCAIEDSKRDWQQSRESALPVDDGLAAAPVVVSLKRAKPLYNCTTFCCERAPMFSLQRFFGKDDQFLDLLEASAQECRASVRALHQILQPSANLTLDEFASSRRKGKQITNEIAELLCRTAVTGLEREDIEALANSLYKIPKTVEKFAERYALFAAQLMDIDYASRAVMLEKATGVIVEMVGQLRKGMRLEEMKALNDRMQAIESEADRLILSLYGELFNTEHNPSRLLLRKDLFELLEKAIDRCRDAGNVIYAIVLKNS